MSSENPSEPANYVRDGVEVEGTALRFLEAVTRFNNTVSVGGKLATYEFFAHPEDAVPPIDARAAEPGELYTRFSCPGGQAYNQIRAIEARLIHEERPRPE